MRGGSRKSSAASNVVASTVGVRPLWMTFVGPLAAVVAVLVTIRLNHVDQIQQITQPVCGSWVVEGIVEQPPGLRFYDVSALATVKDDDVWVAGARSRSESGLIEPYLLHWDGTKTAFVPYDDPTDDISRIRDLAAISANDIWAAGDGQGMLHWDGLSWKIIPTGTSSSLNRISVNAISALAKDDIWAVGSFYVDLIGSQPLLMRWDGKEWSKVPAPDGMEGFTDLYDVSMLSHDNVYAVGSSREDDVALQWKGDKWYELAPLLDMKASFYNEGCSGDFRAFGSAGIGLHSLWVVGECSKRSVSDPSTWYLTSAMSTELSQDNYQRHIGLERKVDSSSMFAIAGQATNNMWALGRTGKIEVGVSTIWHTTGEKWQKVQGPNVTTTTIWPNATTTLQWREIDVLEDGIVWLAGDDGEKIMLAKFVPSICGAR